MGKQEKCDYHSRSQIAAMASSIQRSGVDTSERRWFRNVLLEETELALLESELRYRRLAESAQDVIFTLELKPSRRCGYVNSAVTRIIGYTPEELYDDPNLIVALVHPGDRQVFEEMFDTLVAAKVLTFRSRHKDGHTVWLEMQCVPVCDDAGEIAAIDGIARDITERKNVESELRQAQRLELVGRMAGQVAHDLNNLLGPFLGLPELIKMSLPQDHPTVRYCDAMLDAANQIVTINEDLLTFTRRRSHSAEPTNLNQVVKRAVDSLPSLPDTLDIATDLATDLVPAGGTPTQLLRAVFNLLVNARDAMHDDGVLTIRTSNVRLDHTSDLSSRTRVGQYVRLDMGDTGCGIPSEIRDRMFDPFFTTKKLEERRGCGLGLSVVQTIVEDCQGFVLVESEVGEGSTFSIYLPAFGETHRETPRDDAAV